MASSSEIYLYDTIGARSSRIFIDALESLDVGDLVVRINSPGGYVHEGIAIYEAMRRHPARITAIVDGMAASAASYIFQAADLRVMGRYAELMIHDAQIDIADGNADDHQRAAQKLDRMSETIAHIYADRAGRDAATWRSLMRAETWYSAQEAVSAGLADRVEDVRPVAAAHFDLSQFRYRGRTSAPGPRAGAHTRAVAVAAARRRRTHRLTTTKG